MTMVGGDGQIVKARQTGVGMMSGWAERQAALQVNVLTLNTVIGWATCQSVTGNTSD